MDELAFHRALFRPGTIVDAGAHDGGLSLPLAALPGARVLAFEPLPQAFARLQAAMDAPIRCELCIVGAGLAGLNALAAACDYLRPSDRVVLADRRPCAGGMWNTSYDHVALHQPHPMFTAGKARCGSPGRRLGARSAAALTLRGGALGGRSRVRDPARAGEWSPTGEATTRRAHGAPRRSTRCDATSNTLVTLPRPIGCPFPAPTRPPTPARHPPLPKPTLQPRSRGACARRARTSRPVPK